MSKAYHYPEPAVPGGFRCFTCWIPDDERYYGVFWASFEYLASWVAWERDPDKTARAIADYWRLAFDLSRASFLENDPCPQTYPPPLYTTPPPGYDNIPEAVSDNIVVGFVNIAQNIVDQLAEGTDPDRIKLDIVVQLAGYVSGEWYTPVSDLVDEIVAHTPAQQQDAIDNGGWQGLRDAAYCVEPEADLASPSGWQAWLTNAAGWVQSHLGTSSEWLFNAFEAASALLTGIGVGSMASDPQNDGAGFGFAAPSCFWQQTFDFTIDAAGWSAFTMPDETEPRGTYTPGTGWVGELSPPASYKVSITPGAFDASWITDVKVDVYASGADNLLALYDAPGGALIDIWEDFGTGNLTRNLTTPQTLSNIAVYWRVQTNPGNVVAKVTIEGTGDNPFTP